MNKKAFTLIELLAVIVILAIIALIAVPAVLNIIENSRKGAVEASARNIVRAGQLYYATEVIEGNEPTNIDLTTDTLEYDGNKPDKGTLTYDIEGKIYLKMYMDGYCVEVDYNNEVESKKSDSEECVIGRVFLTLNPNGGELTELSKSYTSGDALGDLPTPTKLGYNFTGWTLQDGTAVTENTIINNSMTINANWELGTYTVTLVYNDDVTENTTIEVTYGSTYGELPTPTKAGYNFNGWYTTGGVKVESTTIVQMGEDHTLNAMWGAGTYLLTYDAQGGTVTPGNKSITYDDTYGELPTPTRTGYTFNGWYSASTGGTEITSTTKISTAGNHSIYARWTANTYTVTLKRNLYGNGEVVYFNPVTAKVCSASESSSTTGTKDQCMKWHAFLDSSSSNTVKLLLDHNTTALVAWNSNGGTTPDTVNAQLASDVENWETSIKASARLITATEVNQIAPADASHTWNINDYNTWYYLHTGTTTIYEGAAGTNTYAWLFDNTWNCMVNGCNVAQNNTHGYWTSDLAGSSSGYAWRVNRGVSLFATVISDSSSMGVRPVIEVSKDLLNETKEVTYDSTYGVLPTLERPGYTFLGWYTSGGAKVENTTEVTITSNQTLYAQWKAIPVYEDGTALYFDPTTGETCDAAGAVSTTGTKDQCMKWYAFLDSKTSETVNLLLDHNISTTVAWNADGGETPDTVTAQLQTEITNWETTIKASARLISATEVHKIAPTNPNWNVNDYKTVYVLHTGTTTYYQGAAGTNTYAWLFDNTENCVAVGCNVEQSGNYGYWTSDLAGSGSGYAWRVNCNGGLGSNLISTATDYGVRPVITVSKSIFE